MRTRDIASSCLLLAVLAGGVSVGLGRSPGVSAASSSASTTAAAGDPSVNKAEMSGHGDLAFVSLGALYVLSAGHLRLVVEKSAGAGSPVYSPNRRFLAYDFGGDEVGVALADGNDPHTVGTNGGEDNLVAPEWLPGGDLLVSGHRYQISSIGTPVRVADAPAGLAAFSPSGGRYVFVEDLTKTAPGTSPAGTANWTGTERLEVSTSLFGPRTVWHSTPIRLDHYGVHGDFTSAVVVLPNQAGILLWTDPDHGDDADGSQLYELKAAGGTLTPLATTIGHSVTFGPNGTFTIAAGGDRYAWANKYVDLCTATTANCVRVTAPAGTLTVAPAWSPNKRTLAFVVAAPEDEGAIGQQQINQWYATHHLFLLAEGSKVPVEATETTGAAEPVWSSDSKSLIYVENDSLYLIAAIGTAPVEIAGPLFDRSLWGTDDAAGFPFYGQINWASEFDWSAS